MGRKSRLIECARCEKRKPPAKTDAGFCQACVDHIAHICSDPMLHARGAVCLLNNTPFRSKAMELRGFLSFMHPKMSEREIQEIVRDE